MLAAEYGRKEIARLLVQASADVHKVQDDFTALMLAAQSGLKELVRLLVEADADKDLENARRQYSAHMTKDSALSQTTNSLGMGRAQCRYY